MNYDLNYTNSDGQTVTGKIGSMQSWYCDGEFMFRSQLYYGRVNGSSNNDAVEFTKAGTWTCTSSMSPGGSVTLITFEVAPLDEEPSIASISEPSSKTSSDTPSGSTSDTSSDPIDFGHEDTTVEYKGRTIKMSTKGGVIDDYKTSTSTPSNLVEFDTYCVNIGGVNYAAFCVGDSLKNICWWIDFVFATTNSSSNKIYNAYLKCYSAGINQYMLVGYGHTMGSSDNAFVFKKPGEYILVTSDLGGEKEIARFYVFWPTQDIVNQLSGETEQAEYNCDVNSDGVVDSRDLLIVQMCILGLLDG